MSIPVKYSIKIQQLTEEDVELVRAALDEWLKTNGWYPDVQHIKTKWDDLSWIWYASDWDTPMLVNQAVRSIEALDLALRDLALATTRTSTPTFATDVVYPDEG